MKRNNRNDSANSDDNTNSNDGDKSSENTDGNASGMISRGDIYMPEAAQTATKPECRNWRCSIFSMMGAHARCGMI